MLIRRSATATNRLPRGWSEGEAFELAFLYDWFWPEFARPLSSDNIRKQPFRRSRLRLPAASNALDSLGIQSRTRSAGPLSGTLLELSRAVLRRKCTPALKAQGRQRAFGNLCTDGAAWLDAVGTVGEPAALRCQD